MSYSINLGDILSRNSTGATPYNITTQMRHWKDSVVDIGGYYQASGQYWLGTKTDIVTRQEAEQFFLTRLGAHIVRSDEGGSEQWGGYISEMELTTDGMTQVRSLSDIVTKLRVAYTRYSGNYLLNGSGEQGVISGGTIGVGGTVTVERVKTGGAIDPTWSLDTSWYTHGTKSVHCDMTGLDALNGGGLKFHTATAVTADARYCVRSDIYVSQNTSGCNLTLTVNDGSNEIYNRIVSSTTGTINFARTFDAPASAAGTMNVMIVTPNGLTGANEVIFNADNVQLYQAGTPVQTPWTEDATATADYGLHEETIVCKPMSDAEALQKRNILLTELAYPRTRIVNVTGQSDGLRIMCEGYVFKTFSASTTLGGIKASSTHITDLLTGNAFISAGYVATNATECYIDETQPVNLWTAIKDVIETGGATNTAYIGGVYAGRKFIYEPRPTTAGVKFKNGRWLNMDNSPMNAQSARPCIAYMEDMTGGAGDYTNLLDNPRYPYIKAWEFDGDTETATPTEIQGIL